MSKDKYKVKNWSSYNEGLKQRGSIRLWIQPGLSEQWKWKGTAKRGGQHLYSDTAVELCLTIGKVYSQPLRQTEGFIRSFFEQVGWGLEVPDYTTLCRRSKALAINLCSKTGRSITDIVVDSTGLKVYGEGEWKVRKHGAGKHRTWMKLHVALDEVSQQIQAVTLTSNGVDDATEVPALLRQIQQPIGGFKGDGAYDKHKVRKELHKRGIKQIIPPQHNAVVSKKRLPALQARDKSIETIAIVGRTRWKAESGYHQRSKAETVMFRYKTIIGDYLSARKIENQQTEIKIGCKILNIMLQTNKPISSKVA
jgi:IS5 family transposase